MAGKGLRGIEKPPAGLPIIPAAADGGYFALTEKCEAFKSCRLVINSKSDVFASPMRYFYFTEPFFGIVSFLLLISLETLCLNIKIPHRSAGFLPAFLLSMQVGGDYWTRTSGLMRVNIQ